MSFLTTFLMRLRTTLLTTQRTTSVACDAGLVIRSGIPAPTAPAVRRTRPDLGPPLRGPRYISLRLSHTVKG